MLDMTGDAFVKTKREFKNVRSSGVETGIVKVMLYMTYK
jgi:hypothetical protein